MVMAIFVYFGTVREIEEKISGKFLVLCFYFLNDKPLENHFLKKLFFLKGAKKQLRTELNISPSLTFFFIIIF